MRKVIKFIYSKFLIGWHPFKKSKCCIAQTSVEFLGHQIDCNGIKPPPSKVESLNILERTKDNKEVVRMLGMFGFYQRYIANLAKIVFPLRRLAKQLDFAWTDVHQQAFEDIKSAMVEAIQLTFLKKNCHFTITANASSHEICACLNQVDDGIGNPVLFFSRKLSDTKTR